MADNKAPPKSNPANKTQNTNKKKGPANKPQDVSAPVAAITTEAPSNTAVAFDETAPLTTSDNSKNQELRGVVVSGLPIEYTNEELRELGTNYGRIVAVRLLKPDWNTNTRSGYIQYNSKVDAGYATYILDGKFHRKIQLRAECKNLSKEAPPKKKVEEVKPTKALRKKEQMSLRFLSPMNPATDTIVANQNQPMQNFTAAPPVDNWTNYPPDTGAPAVNLPEAPAQQPTRQSGKNRRPPQQSPTLREDDDQDYNIQEVDDAGWSQPRSNNNGGRRGGRGGRGRRGGRGGRRNAEYVPAGEYRDDQYQQDTQQGSSTTYPSQQQQKNQKQFKVKQPQSDLPVESSPTAPNEPQTQNQPQQTQPKKNNQKRPNNNNNNKPKSPQQQSNPQSPAPIIDEYEVTITHLKTKDPKTKFRIPAEQQPNFLKAIEAWLPAN